MTSGGVCFRSMAGAATPPAGHDLHRSPPDGFVSFVRQGAREQGALGRVSFVSFVRQGAREHGPLDHVSFVSFVRQGAREHGRCRQGRRGRGRRQRHKRRRREWAVPVVPAGWRGRIGRRVGRRRLFATSVVPPLVVEAHGDACRLAWLRDSGHGPEGGAEGDPDHLVALSRPHRAGV